MTQPLTLLTGRHPEQADDEVFLGNFTLDGYPHCGWKTKRMGSWAYRLDGQLADKALRPVFMKASEAQAAGLSVRDGQVYSPGYEDFLRKQGILAMAQDA